MPRGFTLLELSIVLVIIGLITGGILVGRDLIKAAEGRSQIKQVTQFNTATNVFRDKYDALPGDITAAKAARYGFAARGSYGGQGDGSGLIQGVDSDAPSRNQGLFQAGGETALFWSDLAAANLISGTFTSATKAPPSTGFFFGNEPQNFFPRSSVGAGFVLVTCVAGKNYFVVSGQGPLAGAATYGTPLMTVAQAQSIDAKMDDGKAQYGAVLAAYLTQFSMSWAYIHPGLMVDTTNFQPLVGANAYPAAADSCIDNANVFGAVPDYSNRYPAENVNCGLSFRMQ